MRMGEVPTSQVKKHFPLNARRPINKCHTSSSRERPELLNNHGIWDVVGMGTMGTTTIVYLPAVVTNNKGETVIRDYHRLSLGDKLDVEISQDHLLDTVTTANPVQLDTMHSIIPPRCISKCTKS